MVPKIRRYRDLTPAGIILILLVGLLLPGCSEKSGSMALKLGLAEEPRTLNVWLASDANSRKVLSLFYQPLYVREPEQLRLTPWLAEGDPVYDPQAASYTVRLRNTLWSDGSELTAADVAFTVNLIKEFKIPRHYSRWKFISKIETPDPRTIRFFLKEPKAIFLTRSLTIPIVQQKEWEEVIRTARKQKKPLAYLLNYDVKTPVSSGPFVLKEWRQGAYLHLVRNNHFFGTGQTIAGRRLGPYVEDIIFKIYGTSDVAILALKKGSIDMFWWSIQPGYLDDLRGMKEIQVFESEKSALYYLGFNLRKPPFDNPAMRKAVAVMIDRDFIIHRILQGHGSRMYSVIPAGNRYWHYPEIPSYAKLENREERIRAATEILAEAGYSWESPPVDAAGQIAEAQEIRLPDGRPMERFTILTPPADYDPHRAICGMLVQEWLRDLGMPAFSRPMAFGAMIQQIKGRREFDAFILGYGKLSSDPDYLRIFFHSRNDRKRGWNMSGYKNPEFDQISTESLRTMDRESRRELIWKMQRIIMEDVPYIPIYNPSLIEAVRTDRFHGWVQMLEGIGNIWSFCELKPTHQDQKD